MNKLPDCIIVEILWILDDKDVVMMARTCKRFKRICESTESLWEEWATYHRYLYKSIKKDFIKCLVITCNDLMDNKIFRNIENLPYLDELHIDLRIDRKQDLSFDESLEVLYIIISKRIKRLTLRVNTLRYDLLRELLEKYTLEELIIGYRSVKSNYSKQIFIKVIGDSYKYITLKKRSDPIKEYRKYIVIEREAPLYIEYDTRDIKIGIDIIDDGQSKRMKI
jgi:hypothetical protein